MLNLKPGNHENQTIHNRNADRTGFFNNNHSGSISSTSRYPGKQGTGQFNQNIFQGDHIPEGKKHPACDQGAAPAGSHAAGTDFPACPKQANPAGLHPACAKQSTQ